MGKEEIQFEVFRTHNLFGRVRYNWRIRDLTNDFILGGSTGQNYSRKIDAIKTAKRIISYASMAKVVEAD